jgi:hypothetical protein
LWFATPSTYEICIHYTLPIFTGARAIAFQILRALSSICHPEERSDEVSAVALRTISGKIASLAPPTFTAKQEKTTADPSLRSG